jgi:hypoxanthine phosphoribosyltransferase
MTALEIILTVISFVGFIGTVPQIWGSDWGNIFEYYFKGRISWDQVNRTYLKVARSVKGQPFSPTVIIGVGRGGMVAAGLLCSEFIKKVAMRYGSNPQKTQTPKIKIGVINSTIYFKDNHNNFIDNSGLRTVVEEIVLHDPEVTVEPNDKVLLVGAQTFSGQSLKDAKNLVVKKGVPPENILTATLFHHKHPRIDIKYHPDIVGMNTKISKTMPWKNEESNTDRY